MTQAQKLEALVRRAGLVEIEAEDSLVVSYNRAGSVSVKVFAPSGALRYSQQFSIFNHDFARALFGEEPQPVQFTDGKVRPFSGNFDEGVTGRFTKPAFEVRLMMAVISEDPIDYMYEAVFGES